MKVPLKWQGKLSILFESCHTCGRIAASFFCYKLGTNMLICCPIINKMVLSVVSACLIADYLPYLFAYKTIRLYDGSHLHLGDCRYV